MEKKFCAQCGNHHDPQDRFCRYCGCFLCLDGVGTGNNTSDIEPRRIAKSEALLSAESNQRAALAEKRKWEELRRKKQQGMIKCPQCGNLARPEKGYCEICSSLLKRYNSVESLLNDPFIPDTESQEDIRRYHNAAVEELNRLTAKECLDDYSRKSLQDRLFSAVMFGVAANKFLS